ncbi:MAG: hypothetical protein RB296_04470 [Acidobacteriota bacterium]|jgi:hypothetical protein|nr:hypothetical protein [Acidobacteriota bacterium]
MKKYFLTGIVGALLVLSSVTSSFAIVRCLGVGDEPESACFEDDIEVIHYRINALCIGWYICRITYRFICIDSRDGLPYPRTAYVDVVDYKCPGWR